MEPLQGSMLLLLLAAGCVHAYRPVIIVHGLFHGSTDFNMLTRFISKVHPGTQVMAIAVYNNMASLTPMWKQVEAFRLDIADIMRSHPDGVHLLCFSQGGLICRGVLATMSKHNVHSFISLASPLAGQYGEPNDLTQAFPNSMSRIMSPICYNKQTSLCNYWREPNSMKPILPASMKSAGHHICYNRMGQRVSLCNYWNDPHHRSSYLKGNPFLPLLNGERPHKEMQAWKENFLRIKKLVLIGGPDDGVIMPWQSSYFGFYDGNKNIVEMRDQKFYKDDTFGLKTLDERGDISLCIQPGVKHIHWYTNFTVFKACMEEWLT